MSAAAKDSEAQPNVKIRLQNSSITLEFIPKDDTVKSESEVQEEVHEILTQMYIRSRTRIRSKDREGVLADAA